MKYIYKYIMGTEIVKQIALCLDHPMEMVLRVPGESSGVNWRNVYLRVRCKCDVGIFVVYTVFTFNLFTLMYRQGRVMLQIKNLFIAWAVEITFVFDDWQHVIKRRFKIAIILRPISQTGCKKVAKTHFVDFDFDFLAKKKGQRAHFGICYWSVNIFDNPFKK